MILLACGPPSPVMQVVELGVSLLVIGGRGLCVQLRSQYPQNPEDTSYIFGC